MTPPSTTPAPPPDPDASAADAVVAVAAAPSPRLALRDRRPAMYRIITSTAWNFADRFVRMGIGLVVGVWVARYLGPADFGLLNYAAAFVGLFGVLASLGLDNLVIRDLVRDPARTDETLGSAFVLKLAGSALALTLAVSVIALVRADDTVTRVLVAIVASSLLFAAADTFDLYFQSQVTTKYTVWSRNAAFVTVAAGKVALIVAGAGVVWFALAQLVETAIGAALLATFYRRAARRSVRAWRPTRARVRQLLGECWPMILTSLAVIIYMRIDQVMLKEMAGEREVGIYSAALRLSEVWYFVPMAVVASVFPSVVRVRETNRALYYERLLRLFSLMAGIGICLSVPIAFGSRLFIGTLYGQRYLEAAPVLAVHIWASVFVAWGVAQEPWNIAEGLTRLTLLRTVAGAVINVGLNLLLIPRYGSLGAAWATLVAYAFAGVGGNLLSRRTWVIFRLQMKSVLFPLYLYPGRAAPPPPPPPSDGTTAAAARD